MTPAEYFALCTCVRIWAANACTGRDLDPRCPWHSRPVDERAAMAMGAQLGLDGDDTPG